jgi:putative oxidoreductase
MRDGSSLPAAQILFLKWGGAAMSGMNYVAAIGRLLIAAIFLWSGIHKFQTPAETQAYIASANIPMPVIAYWAATAVEIIGGICLVLGLAVRPAALVLVFYTIAAAVFFHSKFTDQMQSINFMKNVAMAGGLLQVVAFGSGGLALTDRQRS